MVANMWFHPLHPPWFRLGCLILKREGIHDWASCLLMVVGSFRKTGVWTRWSGFLLFKAGRSMWMVRINKEKKEWLWFTAGKMVGRWFSNHSLLNEPRDFLPIYWWHIKQFTNKLPKHTEAWVFRITGLI